MLGVAYAISALLIAWLAGSLLIEKLCRLGRVQSHPAMSLGLGLFLGLFVHYCLFAYAARFLDLPAAVLATCATLGSCAGMLWWTQRSCSWTAQESQTAQIDPPLAGKQPLLLWIVIGLIGLHLALTTIEVLHRPVFPWDAWHHWMYRAKAWYLSGEVSVMDDVTAWARGEINSKYAVAGAHYPVFLPTTALWFSVALGQWSETLVNLPYLACGTALALGVFGLARQAGLSCLVATVLAYLLLSLPLIGAHLSLAGQADIWMAGFCGLGFAALCSGQMQRSTMLSLLGLLLIGCGAQVKVEGTVWALAAVILFAFTSKPKLVAAASLLVLLLVISLFLLGLQSVDLPVLGTAGVVDGRLFVPLIGSYALQSYTLGDDYLSNFFLGGSWHLLWFGTVVAVVSSSFQLKQRSSFVFLSFLLIASAAQITIFFFTEQGAWADDWTAINRLPLHFAPAVLLAIFLQQTAATHSDANVIAAKATTRLFLLSVVGASILSLIYLYSKSDSVDAPSFQREGRAMNVMVGAGRGEREASNALQVTRYDNNIALLSSGPISLDADRLKLLSLKTRGSNRREFTFFWRLQSDGDLYSVTIDGLGHSLQDLSSSEFWKGAISELGFVFYDDDGTVVLEEFSLASKTLAGLATKVWQDWRFVTPWSQRSVHWLPAGNISGLLPLPVFLAGFFLVAISIRFLPATSLLPVTQRSTSLIFFALICWLCLDLRWLVTRTALASQTLDAYDLAGSAPLEFGDDKLTAAAVDRATCNADSDLNKRMLIAADSEKDMRFQLLRAKYHALPAAAYAHESIANTAPPGIANQALVLKLRYGVQGEDAVGSGEVLVSWNRRMGSLSELIWEDQSAFLIAPVGEAAPKACQRDDR
ncbi:MAG: hypothetical protein AAF098_02485 [Pseudomonadota bacterium]